MNSIVISSFLAVTVGFIATMYNGVAEKYGWHIGKLFSNHKGWIAVIGWICIISGSIELISELHFLKGIFAVVVALILAVISMRIFKSNIQWISLIAILASIIIWIIGGAEIVQAK